MAVAVPALAEVAPGLQVVPRRGSGRDADEASLQDPILDGALRVTGATPELARTLLRGGHAALLPAMGALDAAQVAGGWVCAERPAHEVLAAAQRGGDVWIRELIDAAAFLEDRACEARSQRALRQPEMRRTR